MEQQEPSTITAPDGLPGRQDTYGSSLAPVRVSQAQYQRSGIICSGVAERCGLQKSRHWWLLCASRKCCSQQGALGLLPECHQVALSLQGHQRSWAPSGAPQRWQCQSCRGHEEMQQGGKGLCRKGGWNVSRES